jgi:uncharacterized membrane protein
VLEAAAVTKVISARRAAYAFCAGAAAGVAAGAAGSSALMPIVGWTVAAATILLWTWRIIWPLDAAGTKQLAEGEARVRTTDTAVVSAAVVSLVAVVLALEQASQPHTVAATVIVLLSVVSVALSWAVVNTVFALKYARHYYIDRDGGFDFCGATPAYTDFAYVAFTVGMTFAVAETTPTTTAIRRTVLGHALLSYVFGTGILAVAINLVTNLAQ